MQIKPQQISEIDFSAYGRIYHLGGSLGFRFTDADLMERAYKLGMTHSGAGSFKCSAMERHVSTEEILFAGDGTLALCVSLDSPAAAPEAGNILCVLIEPGDVVVLNKGVWHDACRGLEGKDTLYYFMALNNGEASELKWVKVQPEGPEVQLPCAQAAFDMENHEIRPDAESSLFIRRSLMAEGYMTGPEWECWQTGTVCPTHPARLGFAKLKAGETLERVSCEDAGELLLCGGAELLLSFNDGTAVDLLPGELISIVPAANYAVTAKEDGWCYLLVR